MNHVCIVTFQSKMEVIEWETVPESEIKAEIAAALESSGEARRLKAQLAKDPQIQEWRKTIEQQIIHLEQSEDITKLTPDEIYEKISGEAHNAMPQEVLENLSQQICKFLENEFDNHI